MPRYEFNGQAYDMPDGTTQEDALSFIDSHQQLPPTEPANQPAPEAAQATQAQNPVQPKAHEAKSAPSAAPTQQSANPPGGGTVASAGTTLTDASAVDQQPAGETAYDAQLQGTLAAEAGKLPSIPSLIVSLEADNKELRHVGVVPAEKKDRGTPNDKSGITVGVGVDLNQQSQEGLLKLGVPAALVDKLRPYMKAGHGETARAFLKKHPIRLTDAEEALLSKAVFKKTFYATKKGVEGLGLKWDKIPAAAQDVLQSLVHNFGAEATTYKTFKAAAKGQYAEAVKHLRNASEWEDSALMPRRNKEADVLEGLIKDNRDAASTQQVPVLADAGGNLFNMDGTPFNA